MHYMKYCLACIALLNLSVYGCREKAVIPNTNENFIQYTDKIRQTDETDNSVQQVNARTFYVAPHDGLNLRTEPGLGGARIRSLRQYTKLTVIDTSSGKETIDGINDYWYKVDTGEDTGWVFGGYLIFSPPGNYNVIVEKPDILENGILQFKTGKTINMLENWLFYYDIGDIRVYDKTTKDSNYTRIYNEDLYLVKLDENEDWLYTVSMESGTKGFIFIYDISEESFYGKHKKESKEYKITQEHPNIKRFGPLLVIYLNNDVIKIWDKFSTEGGMRYNFIADYYPEYNEVLIRTAYYEGADYSIFSLRRKEYICSGILGYPHFNPSRERFFSIGEFYTEEPQLQIYEKRGDYFRLYKEESLDYRYSEYDIQNVEWVNYIKAVVHYKEGYSLEIEIQ